MSRKGKWVKINNFDDEFLKNPLSVVQLLTKVLRYQGLIYNRVSIIQKQIDYLVQKKLTKKEKERLDRIVYGDKNEQS